MNNRTTNQEFQLSPKGAFKCIATAKTTNILSELYTDFPPATKYIKFAASADCIIRQDSQDASESDGFKLPAENISIVNIQDAARTSIYAPVGTKIKIQPLIEVA